MWVLTQLLCLDPENTDNTINQGTPRRKSLYLKLATGSFLIYEQLPDEWTQADVLVFVTLAVYELSRFICNPHRQHVIFVGRSHWHIAV